MALRMAKLTRTSSGLWTARKAIPADVREAYGKREEKPTWPASLSSTQAKAEFGAWLVGIEEKIAALRSTVGGPSVTLTHRQSLALAAKWYEGLIVRWKDDLTASPTKRGTLRSAKTVRETYLAAAKAVFGFAKDNRKIAADPTQGVKVRGAKRQRLRDPGFSNEEAETILRATVQPITARINPANALARRWVPWLCA